MAAKSNAGAADPLKREVTITRIIDAPRTLVYKAWTDPKLMARWFGPRTFTNPVCELDVRPGGALHIVMRAPNGTEHPMIGVFNEVIENERLVFTSTARDAKGGALLESVATVTFADQSGKTKLTVHASAVGFVSIAAQMLAGMEAGWTQSLEKLTELAAG